MAQLYFKYGAMGSSKTANALMTRFNYEERGQKTLLVKPRLDTRDGDHMVVSRIGLTYPCIYFDEMQQLSVMELQQNACVIVDEAQFLTREEVMYLVGLVDDLGIPVICYGLRADFKGDLFPGSEALLVMADKIEEVKTICWCGKKATFNARFDHSRQGPQGGRAGGAGGQRPVHRPVPQALDGRGPGPGLPPGGHAVICRLCPRNCGAERTETEAGRRVPPCPAFPWRPGPCSTSGRSRAWWGSTGPGRCFSPAAISGAASARTSPSPRRAVGKPLTVERLREIFHELIDQGAACLDLVTPTHFTDAVLEALGDEEWPVPVVWNCGGYEKPETLRRLEGKVQVYLPDLKYALPGARPEVLRRGGLL